MSQALAKLTSNQLELLKSNIAKGATDAELALFIQVCERLGLDPFSRQIYLVPRWDKQVGGLVRTPQVSIDGFRVAAERTGEYEGQTPPQWCGEDGEWRDVWLSNKPPAAARCGVYRKGFREPLYAVATWRSYAQTDRKGDPTPMWRKMGDVMLSKCSESLCLRKSFPNLLSGVYTTDEMSQSIDEPSAPGEHGARVAGRHSMKKVNGTAEPVHTATEFFDKIAATGSLEELADVGAAIKSAGFDDATKRALSPAYQSRRLALGGE